MVESIQQAVKPHDKYQIEIKLDYELQAAEETHYTVETYFFVPQNLGVSAETYTKANFYRDLQNYIRLKTPTFLLRDFTESDDSPLTTIEHLISRPNWINRADQTQPLLNNLKLLSAMLKSAIRDHLNHIHNRIDESTSNGHLQIVVHDLALEFLEETAKISETFRHFFPVFNLPRVNEKLFTAYTLTDESISILIEEGLIELFEIVETHLAADTQADFKQCLTKRVQEETHYRRTRGYQSVLDTVEENEKYLFRASVLKKYASSVLHLSTTVEREGRRLKQLLYAVAAGISMVFATIVAFYFQRQYGNFTLPLFIALVVGYMFKDRIKELGRQMFTNHLRDRLPDRRIDICTQEGKQLGTLKEKVAFITEEDVPRLVLKARNRDHFTELDNDGRGENIIRHTREVTLHNQAFKRIYEYMPQISGVNDIIRYNLRAYLNKMAEPVQIRRYLKDGEIHTVACHKVYHLNLVSRYKARYPHKEKIHSRLRLVLNREGIKRIEHVSAPP